MRVLVAGATSVPGLPLLRELNARGHDVVGLTRSPAKTSQIEATGAKAVVADVFDPTTSTRWSPTSAPRWWCRC